MLATIVFVKEAHGHYHRTWITPDGTDGEARLHRVHVQHDLPHLVVESFFGLDDGLWGPLVGDGAMPGLTKGHLRAKAVTNAVVNRWGEGPDDAAGVPARTRDVADAIVDAIDDATIEAAIAGVRDAYAMWNAVPVDGRLRLPWPLPRDFWADH